MPNSTQVMEGSELLQRCAKLKEEGNACLKSHDFPGAIKNYTAAINLAEENETETRIPDPNIHIYYANRAQANLQLENYGAALLDSSASLEHNDSYVKAYYRRGIAAMNMGKFEEALADFKRVIKLSPRDVKSRQLLASLKREVYQIKFSEAIAEEWIQPLYQRLVLSDLHIPTTYTGPSWEGDEIPETGLATTFLSELIHLLKEGKTFPRKLASAMILKFIEIIRVQDNIVKIDVPNNTKFTICGDVHGQFYDLINIFELNGLPSKENPYLFNGDFVDRGSWSIECVLVLMTAKVIYPQSLFMSRGNHETQSVNKLYGFQGECTAKYGSYSNMYQLFSEAFRWLPVAHILDNEIFVVHGGLPDRGVTLEDINSFDRWTATTDGPQNLFTDLLWADPTEYSGSRPSPRGISNLFGPDITKQFLNTNNLKSVVRSHEVRPNGHETTHGGLVTTIFSAPNYCDSVGNLGAYINYTKVEGRLESDIVTFKEVAHPYCTPLQYASPFVKMSMN